MFQLLLSSSTDPTTSFYGWVAFRDVDFEGVPVAFKTLEVVTEQPKMRSQCLQSSDLNGWVL